jgi:hypothetical protein
MWKRRKKKDQPTVNMLDLIPVRLLESETGSDGRATLFKPRFTNRLLVKYLMPRFSRPNFQVTLDDFGSHVWSRIDGSATVRDIGRSLREAFGEEVEPVYQRLGLFCRQLAANRFVELTGWPETDGTPLE